jgi:hypothetical protein
MPIYVQMIVQANHRMKIKMGLLAITMVISFIEMGLTRHFNYDA